MVFRILFGIDAVAAAIVVWFFFIGLADGSVSSFNIGLWLGILAAIAAIFVLALALRATRRPLATALLAVPAVPVLLYGAFMLVVILSGERWN